MGIGSPLASVMVRLELTEPPMFGLWYPGWPSAPPTHPSAEALLAFIPATAQIFAALHDAYASLYPGSEPPRSLEPSLPLVLLAFGALLPALGKHTFFTFICLASSSFSLECTLRSAATNSGTLPNNLR